MVELVVALPLLFSMLLGVTTGGRAYATRIGMVDAVREGARFGATLQLGTGPTAATDFGQQVTDRIVAAAAGELTPADVCVSLVLPGSPLACGVADPTGAAAQPGVHLVKVSATKPATLQFFFGSRTTTISVKSVARYERDTG